MIHIYLKKFNELNISPFSHIKGVFDSLLFNVELIIKSVKVECIHLI